VGTGQSAETYIGTAIYMSPERVKAQNYGMESDIWSLGMLLIECLLGKHPLEM
jgi:serine/threonine protein kinase